MGTVKSIPDTWYPSTSLFSKWMLLPTLTWTWQLSILQRDQLICRAMYPVATLVPFPDISIVECSEGLFCKGSVFWTLAVRALQGLTFASSLFSLYCWGLDWFRHPYGLFEPSSPWHYPSVSSSEWVLFSTQLGGLYLLGIPISRSYVWFPRTDGPLHSLSVRPKKHLQVLRWIVFAHPFVLLVFKCTSLGLQYTFISAFTFLKRIEAKVHFEPGGYALMNHKSYCFPFLQIEPLSCRPQCT